MAVSLVTVIAIGSLVGGVVCLGTAVVAWRHRTVTAALPLVGVLVATALWSFANAGLLLAPSANAAYVADRVYRAAAVQVPPIWLVFVVAFTGREELLTLRNLAVLWLYPAAYIVASITAPYHGFASAAADVSLVTKNGLTAYVVPTEIVYGVSMVVAFAMVLLSLWILSRFILRSREVYRKQMIVLLFSATVPSMMMLVTFFGFLPHPALDPTPIVIASSALLVAWALVRYGLLTVTPLARDVLVDELPDPVFVLDEDDAVVDHNPAAAATFGVDDPTGKSMASIEPGLLDRIESGFIFEWSVTNSTDVQYPDGKGTAGKGTAGNETTRNGTYGNGTDESSTFYDPTVTSFEDQHGNEHNRLVVLRDVTGQQRRQQRLETLQEATRQFLAASTAEEIAEIGVEYADAVLDTHGTAVFLTDDDTDRPEAVAMTDTVGSLFERGKPPAEPMAGTLATAYEHDVVTSQELPGDIGGASEASLGVPLGDHGVVWYGTRTAADFDPDDRGYAMILARTTQVALTRVERESALRRSRSSVERRSEQIAFFNGVLRHTLRNALLVIQGRAEYLRNQVPEGEELHVDTIVDWCDDLTALNEEIRAVSDTVTATESERLDEINLTTMLVHAVRRFEGDHESVTFETDIDAGLQVQANELGTRVIDSVIENAVVHNDRADPHIEVWTVRAADRVQVHIADDGPGMDDEMKANVVERDLSTSETASGFGLYFVSVLMNLYGGTVWFEDNHPRGTVAVLEFQVVESEEVPENEPVDTDDADVSRRETSD